MATSKKLPTDWTQTTFAERVKFARERADMSQNKLVAAAKLSNKGAVSLIESGERGKRPTDEMVSKLAVALGVQQAWLGQGKGPMTAAEERGESPKVPGEMSLAEIVATYPGRWSSKVVAAGAGAYAGGTPDKGWVALLDDLQKVLEP